ncbi:MAG: UDP-glucose/GDP-mannose dehydrogenase family protein [Clostridia bacterium]
MKLTVAGTGYVGLVAGVCFAQVGHTVTCVDVDEAKIASLQEGISPIFEEDLEELMQKNIAAGRLFFSTDVQSAYADADAIFIGVGTPEQPDGSANLSYIAAVCRQIAESVVHDCLVVVKSTVPVGTNEKVEQYIKDNLDRPVRIMVASNPEFLAQGNAVRDTLHASRIVIGTDCPEAENLLTQIYAPFELPIVSVSRRSAEMIKYASNDFLALKLSYMNDIANLCELVGANIDDVAEGMRYDARIGAKFLRAGIGYGGSCFPKDTKALQFLAQQHGYRLRTVEAAVAINAEQKTRLFHKAKERFMSFDHLKVAVLGLAFKPGTDDLREAPSLDNIQLLTEAGADITAYDPVAADHFHKRYPAIKLADTPEGALAGAGVCFVFTEWDEIVRLSPEIFKVNMRVPLVYDGRNIFDPKTMADGGVEYYSIGR